MCVRVPCALRGRGRGRKSSRSRSRPPSSPRRVCYEINFSLAQVLSDVAATDDVGTKFNLNCGKIVDRTSNRIIF